MSFFDGLKDIKINRGLGVSMIIASSYLPPLLYVRLFHSLEFKNHDLLTLSLLCGAAGFCVNVWFTTTVLVSLRDLSSENSWTYAPVVSSFYTTLLFSCPIGFHIGGKHLFNLLIPDYILFVLVGVLSIFILWDNIFGRRKKRIKPNIPTAVEDHPHLPEQEGHV